MIDFNNLPKFQLISRLTNSPNLVGYDVEDNLLPDINFNYYSITMHLTLTITI
jgi:hypothetical protein